MRLPLSQQSNPIRYRANLKAFTSSTSRSSRLASGRSSRCHAASGVKPRLMRLNFNNRGINWVTAVNMQLGLTATLIFSMSSRTVTSSMTPGKGLSSSSAKIIAARTWLSMRLIMTPRFPGQNRSTSSVWNSRPLSPHLRVRDSHRLPTAGMRSTQNSNPRALVPSPHSPFHQAVGGPPHPPPPTASSARRKVTTSSTTKTPPQPSNSLTVNLRGRNAPVVASSLPTTGRFASSGTSEETSHLSSLPAPTARMNALTCAPSAAAKATTPSPGPVAPSQPSTEDFVLASRSPLLQYVDFSPSIIPRSPLPHSLPEHSLIFNQVSHPYNPNAFDFFLLKHNLSSAYPFLTFNLRHGFPLGHMPPLLHTVILPNNPSIQPHMDFIDEYLQKELLAGRMSGPFSCMETELILRGPFQSSPLIVAVQPQHPGVPDKLRVCRHLSKSTKTHASVNSHIRKEDFPTRFDLATKVAHMVSTSLFYIFPTLSLLFLCTLLRFVRGAVFSRLQYAV